ncbi:MAG: hypothetical protein U0326_42550 [Polyangiales bacterium]
MKLVVLAYLCFAGVASLSMAGGCSEKIAPLPDDATVAPCSAYATCGACTSGTSCGWCGGRCVSGTSTGPTDRSQCGSNDWVWTSLNCPAPCPAGQINCGGVCNVTGGTCSDAGSGGCQSVAVCEGTHTTCSGVRTSGACTGVTGGECGRTGDCACPSTLTNCDGVCVDLASDGANCGRCGNACPTGRRCSNAACATSCAGASCGSGCCGASQRCCTSAGGVAYCSQTPCP